MERMHPKLVRRRMLERMYERYMRNPLEMLGPADFLGDGQLTREDVVIQIHYLHDSGLAELMVGYNPQSFNAARITAKGIDLVENRFEFLRRFPLESSAAEHPSSEAIRLAELLVEQVDLVALDAETRRGLRQDVDYLRSELSRPEAAQRLHVLRDIVIWMEQALAERNESLPALAPLGRLLREWPDKKQS